MRIKKPVHWVVYRAPVRGTDAGANAICEQSEWDAMDAARPGYFTLVQDRMANEGEAERLARGTSGDKVRGGSARPSKRAAVPAL